METSEATKPEEQHQAQPDNGRIMPADELKRLTDFFSILIEIDRRINNEKTYGKQTK
jgi:hypothetical protein